MLNMRHNTIFIMITFMDISNNGLKPDLTISCGLRYGHLS